MDFTISVYGAHLLVPEEGRTLYASTAFYKMLLQCDEDIRLDKAGDTALVKGKVGEILNMDVKKVPSTYLPEGVLFMIVLKDSAYGPVKLWRQPELVGPVGSAAMRLRLWNGSAAGRWKSCVLSTSLSGVKHGYSRNCPESMAEC